MRTLGLGALMALALLALPAGASAKGGLISDGPYSPTNPVTLSGASVSGSHPQLYFSSFGSTFTCPISVSGQLAEPTGKVPLTFSLGGQCTGFKANGCKLEIRPGTENSFDIGPPGCGPAKFGVWICPVSIGSQSGLAKNVTYTNTGAGKEAKVMVETKSSEIKYTSEMPGGGGCGTPGTYTGGISGKWDIKGLEAVGLKTGVYAVDSFGGLFLTGEESEAGQQRFEAESYPYSISGTQWTSDKLELYLPSNGMHITCAVVEFGGQISSPTAELPLEAKYSGCTIPELYGGTAAVKLNGCGHALGVDEFGPSSYYLGSLDLSCGESVLEVLVDPKSVGECIVKIPGQALGSVSHANLGAGTNRSIVSFIDGKGLSYTLTEIGFLGCFGKSGSFEDGVFGGTLSLGSI